MMKIRWNRFGAVVCVMVSALCLTPALAATAKPAAAHTARSHTGAKVTAKHTKAMAKGPRAKPHAATSAARKVGKPHAVGASSRPANRASARVQRQPVSAPHGALRHAASKKSVRTGAGRHAVQPATAKPGAKVHATAAGKRTARKAPPLRPGHKKTAH